MNARPSFSIVIPVYNIAPYLRMCLDSVLLQTFTDWEAICVDDGSTDGSGEILDEYAAKDKRFRVVHQMNAGVSSARNKALDESHGDWLMFCDSDDAFAPETLEILRERLGTSEYELITFEMVRVVRGEDAIAESPDQCENVFDMSNAEDVEHLIKKCFPHRLWAWNKCFKRTLVNDLRFENYQPCEDAVFVLECIFRARRILELPNVLYKYVQHEGSCLKTISAKRLEGDINGMRRLCEVALSSPFAENIKRLVYHRLRDVFLCGIPNNISKLQTEEDGIRVRLENEFFEAARQVFVLSKLTTSLEKRQYSALFCFRSVNIVVKYFRYRRTLLRYIMFSKRCFAKIYRVCHGHKG